MIVATAEESHEFVPVLFQTKMTEIIPILNSLLPTPQSHGVQQQFQLLDGAARVSGRVVEVMDAAGQVTVRIPASDIRKVSRGYNSVTLKTVAGEWTLRFVKGADADTLRDTLKRT
jgi:hypothetical protein